MFTSATENLLAKVIAIGSGLTTIFIVSGSVTDPVNVTKLLSLGVTSAIATGLVFLGGVTGLISKSKFTWVACGLFLVSGLLSVVMSNSPISQGVYGTYGRNNGLLAYLFLVGLLLSTVVLSNRANLVQIIKWLIIAGLVNVGYCLWVISFGDFIGWNNPYGNILGTLGNPNFIGSFLGIFFAAYLGYGLSQEASIWLKYSMLIVLPITAFEIYDSNAIQGRIVGISGTAIVGFFIIRSKLHRSITTIYSGIVIVAGVFALMGALQKGPLASIVYKTSVSLRGQYWLAGWNTGERNPFTGAGMDAFGDWYRRSRDAHALDLPGVNVVVNAAHNVPIDMFAFGGWPLFISYILIMGVGGLALIRTIIRIKRYDPLLTVITTAWVGYQLQSVISINQIGLAIWGWVLTGAAIAYERITRNGVQQGPEKIQPARAKGKSPNQHLQAIVVSSVTGVIGILLAVPPFAADSKWRNAQVSRSVQAIEETMHESYFNPHNSMKYLTNIQILEESNFKDLAHKYSLEAVQWNPDAYELWKVLYLISNSTAEEKQLAFLNMRRLDPLNPDVTSRT